MLLKKVLLVWSIAFMVFSASEALAKNHDQGLHQRHLGSIVSPFDSHKKLVSPHCLLKRGAHHQKVKCPHSVTNRVKTTQIALDCGGKRSGAVPKTSSHSSDYVDTYLNPLVYPLQDKQISFIAFLSYEQFINLLDPPPRFI